jgi:hypothetical protein
MYATQAALPLPSDVLAEIDSFRRRRAYRTKTAHSRERLYLAQKWAIPAAQGGHVGVAFGCCEVAGGAGG